MENIDYVPSSFGDIKMSDLNDALAHHGIKGQRWGIRRFQNKDGSLTDAGRKRQTLGERIHARKVKKKRAAALEKARIARAEKQKAAAEREKLLKAGKIKPKDMTEEELIISINKMRLEKNYKDLMAETRPQAKAVSEGKSFASKMMNEAIKPAMAEAGKQVLKNFLIDKGEKALGLKKGEMADPLKELEKTAKQYEYQEKISKAKKNMTLDNDFYEARERKQKEEAEKQAMKDAKKQVDEYNANEAKKREEGKSTYRVHGENLTDPTLYNEGKRKVSGLLSTSAVNDPFNAPAVSKRAETGKSYAYDIIDKQGNYLTSTIVNISDVEED